MFSRLTTTVRRRRRSSSGNSKMRSREMPVTPDAPSVR